MILAGSGSVLLEKAQHKMQNLLTLAENGVNPTALTSRINETQHEIDRLQELVDQTPVPPESVERAEVESLIDEFAGAMDEVFGEDADPELINEFLQAIGLRINFDGETQKASGSADFRGPTPSDAAEIPVGVSVRVRGGT